MMRLRFDFKTKTDIIVTYAPQQKATTKTQQKRRRTNTMRNYK